MEYYGIDLDSYSSGLLGSQGWSPNTSIYSEDDNDLVSASQLKKMSIEFPLPPIRYQTTRPLSVSSDKFMNGRAVSARIEPMILGLDSWNFDMEHRGRATESDNMNFDAFGIFTSKKKATSTAMHIEMPTLNRRVFSAPPPPAYLEMQGSVDDSPAQEPEEYPFPLMNRPRNPFKQDIYMEMEEEKNKMRRLNDSLSLLHVSPKCTELNSWKRASIGMSPLQKLTYSTILSPEHGAPSLQEQMAFASGLGDRYSWSSPSKMTRSSSSSHYLPSVARVMITTHSQDERRMASRHVRQGVAANGSAPLPRSVSMQTALSGQEAEVGSSWSHKGCDDDEDINDDESDEGQYWLVPTETPIDRSSFSQQSCRTSTVDSINSSPILHGILSARDFASQHHHPHSDLSSSSEPTLISPSTCASSIQSNGHGQSSKEVNVDGLFTQGLAIEYGDSESCSDSSESIPTPVDTPNSLHEFSYILDSDEFVASPINSVNVFGNDGFDGNTFSPIMGTPDIADFPPTPIGFAPSPVMDQSSIEPHPSIMLSSPISTISATFSTLSVLERPRPVGRSATTTSFFGNGDAELQIQRISASNSTPSLKKVYEERRPSALPTLSATKVSRPSIPGRKSSLEVVSVLSQPFGNDSNRVSFENLHGDDEKLEKNRRRNLSVSFSMDLEITRNAASFYSSNQAKVVPIGILASNSNYNNSSNNAKTSSKALAQVREACRAKADLIRNITLENLEVEERKREAANKIIKQQLELEKRQHIMIRSGASEAANLHLNIFSKKSAQSQSSTSIKSSKSSFSSPSQKGSSSSSIKSKQKSASSPSSSSTTVNHIRPISRGSATFTVPDSVKLILPTVFVARTDSQRKRGWTGVPETEPETLALIKSGKQVKIPTRQSKVEALIHKSDVQEQGALLNMPHGVVLIVEEKKIHKSIIPV